MGELLRQIRYKAAWRGREVVGASQWFASSKTCSACGLVNLSLTLSQRKWTCECGTAHERDLNAALNLKEMAASRAVTACGGESSGVASAAPVLPDEAGSGLGVVLPLSPAPPENRGIPMRVMENTQLALF